MVDLRELENQIVQKTEKKVVDQTAKTAKRLRKTLKKILMIVIDLKIDILAREASNNDLGILDKKIVQSIGEETVSHQSDL